MVGKQNGRQDFGSESVDRCNTAHCGAILVSLSQLEGFRFHGSLCVKNDRQFACCLLSLCCFRCLSILTRDILDGF